MPKRLTLGELYDRITLVAADMIDAAMNVTEDAPDLLPAVRRKHRAIGELLARIEAHPDVPPEPVIGPALKDHIDAAAIAIEIAQRGDASVEEQAAAALAAWQPAMFARMMRAEDERKGYAPAPVGNC